MRMAGEECSLFLNDQCRHHPEHTVLRLGVRKDVAMERPGTRVVAVDDDVPAP